MPVTKHPPSKSSRKLLLWFGLGKNKWHGTGSRSAFMICERGTRRPSWTQLQSWMAAGEHSGVRNLHSFVEKQTGSDAPNDTSITSCAQCTRSNFREGSNLTRCMYSVCDPLYRTPSGSHNMPMPKSQTIMMVLSCVRHDALRPKTPNMSLSPVFAADSSLLSLRRPNVNYYVEVVVKGLIRLYSSRMIS